MKGTQLKLPPWRKLKTKARIGNHWSLVPGGCFFGVSFSIFAMEIGLGCVIYFLGPVYLMSSLKSRAQRTEALVAFGYEMR